MAKATFVLLLKLTLLLATVPQLTNAANDWSKPCFGGVCSWDLPTSSNGPSGTLKIWGADTAIADITPAANWEILGCDPGSLEQDIRIVCRGGNDDSACAHLFATPAGSAVNGRAVANATSSVAPQPSAPVPTDVASLPSDGKEQSAVGKIVRLPENCGQQPFARIAKAWIPVDQSIPSNVTKRFIRRDSSSGTPTVKAIRLDVNFTAADTSKTGPVNFALVGANVPGAATTGDLDTSNLVPPSGNISNTTTPASVRRSRIYRPRFDKNKSQALKPIDVDKTITLLDQSLSCGVADAKLNVGAEAKAHADITVGVALSGSLLPPKITSVGITSSITADLDGVITVNAGVGGTADSGKIKIFELGIPGLDFPGVLSIGPTFDINGQVTASLELDVDMRVGLSYHIENAQFTFPKGGSSGTFSPKDTPLEITAQPSGSATGSVEAHIIPSLNLGINALAGIVKAGVFVNLDASASMTLTLDATGAEQIATVNPRALDTLPSQKPDAATQAEGSPMAGSTFMVSRGIEMMGEHYLAQRAPRPFGSGDGVDSSKIATPTALVSSTTPGDVHSVASTVAGEKTGPAPAVIEEKVKSAPKPPTNNKNKPTAGPAATQQKTVATTKTTALTTPVTSIKSTATSSATVSAKPTTSTKSTVTSVAIAPTRPATSTESTAASSAAVSTKPATSTNSTVATSATVTTVLTQSVTSTDESTAATSATTSTKPAQDTKSTTPSSAAVSTIPATSTDSTISATASSTKTETATPSATPTSQDASFGGCFEIDAALDVNVGADADFFGLFNPDTSLSLFSKKFQLFKKCFGDANARRSVDTGFVRRQGSLSLEARALKCNPESAGKPTEVVNETVPAANIA